MKQQYLIVAELETIVDPWSRLPTIVLCRTSSMIHTTNHVVSDLFVYPVFISISAISIFVIAEEIAVVIAVATRGARVWEWDRMPSKEPAESRKLVRKTTHTTGKCRNSSSEILGDVLDSIKRGTLTTWKVAARRGIRRRWPASVFPGEVPKGRERRIAANSG